MRRTDTKIRIEAAAIELFGSKGYDATSMRDIAAIVGITEPGLYRHFTGKEELGSHVFTTRYAALAEDLQAAADKALAAGQGLAGQIGGMVDVLLQCYHDTPLLFRFLLLNQHAFLAEIENDTGNVAEVVCKVFVQSEERDKLISDNPDVLAAIVMGCTIHPAVFNLYGRLPGDLGDHRDTLVTAACKSIGL